MRKIDKIILHCAATTASMDIGAKEIRQWHTAPEPNGRGWKDIGYHFVIRRDGTVEKGRDIEVVGAHCAGHNASSIGICLVGGIKKNGQPENNFTIVQFDSLEVLVLKLLEQYPDAKIYGHNDFANKACPVFSVRDFCERDEVLREACGTLN